MTHLEKPKVRDLHPVIWLGMPLASLAIRFLAPLMSRKWWHICMREEIGFVEIATVVFLLPAIVLGVLIFLRRRELPRFVGLLMLVGGLAALYFAGEEISWGQTYLHYSTPECLQEINRQREFNLHNIELAKYGPWIDLLDDLVNNVPRQLMLWGTIIGGIVLPPVLRRRFSNPQARQSAWYWLVPNYRLMPIALMAVLFRIPHSLRHLIGRPAPGSYSSMAIYEASGEFKEYCYALVILLYLLSIFLRMGPRKPTESRQG
ncbi:MAG: hypothetical protein SVT52_02375 [Planctomycetota bacterium]|nr:hypothetical protein [Planctomycetota bacterium]